MYARQVNDQLLTFGVSGKLIMNGLVMYDHQTDSLWSQVLGLGVKGPHEGQRLDMLPAPQTTWAAWVEAHPDTLVLDKGRGYALNYYASYNRRDQAGIIGWANPDDRLRAKEFVLGLLLKGQTKAYPFRELSATPVVNDTVADRDLVIAFDAEIATATALDRQVEGRTLTFRLSEEEPQLTLVDEETGTRWLALTGEALDGPLAGKRLEQVPSTYAFWFGWVDYHPDTALYAASM